MKNIYYLVIAIGLGAILFWFYKKKKDEPKPPVNRVQIWDLADCPINLKRIASKLEDKIRGLELTLHSTIYAKDMQVLWSYSLLNPTYDCKIISLGVQWLDGQLMPDRYYVKIVTDENVTGYIDYKDII